MPMDLTLFKLYMRFLGAYLSQINRVRHPNKRLNVKIQPWIAVIGILLRDMIILQAS